MRVMTSDGQVIVEADDTSVRAQWWRSMARVVGRVVPVRTIEVDFPHGPRNVPAHVEQQDEFITHTTMRERRAWISRVVPDAMEGWEFYETLGGKWVAYRTMRG